ncbi:hypothetical protein T458_06370 [Brevibacillus panacihumi W25]|uniref:YviE n=1 Tax=Brevibacillus panacihumi W25 TaxID=1408254 RepID=V6MA04_9BACL|nr:DUF6470 family protein [Brevibacillus panacihumi]EST55406.1 hypothetical protein T458_06370 [Brevibacillus panacihumi W25]
MRIPQIQMQQTYAQLGLNINKPVQEIQQPRAELNLRQEPAIIEIRQAKGSLTIDSSEARENIDMRGPLRRTRDNADYGYRMAMEAIASISEEGDQLRSIENKQDAIVAISERESMPRESEIIAAGSIVGDGIEIRYNFQPLDIQVQERGKTMDPEIKRPIHNYKPGKVEGYMLRWGSLQIDVIGLHMDQRI